MISNFLSKVTLEGILFTMIFLVAGVYLAYRFDYMRLRLRERQLELAEEYYKKLGEIHHIKRRVLGRKLPDPPRGEKNERK